MKRLIAVALLVLVSFAAQAQAASTFFYVVTSVDSNGLESVNSNEVNATLVQGMTKGVTLTWTAAAASNGATITGYNVYRASKTGGPYTKVNSALVTGGTTYLDPFVSPGAPTLSPPTVN